MRLLVIPWLLTALLSAGVLLWADHREPWFVLVTGAAIAVSLILQVTTAQREGFIARLSLSVAGSVVIVFAAEVVSLILR